MLHLLRSRPALALLLLGALLLAAPAATLADGTETLGPPSIALAPGSGIAVGGVGMIGTAGYQALSVDVPAGAAVNQVLLYWSTEYANLPASAELLLSDGFVTDVAQTGALIGGPTSFLNAPIATYRADITDKGWIGGGANTIYVNTDLATGVGILVVYDDGSGDEVALYDGQDITFFEAVDFGHPAALVTTVPQTFAFAASTEARDVELDLMATGFFAGSLPHELLVTIDGTTTAYADFFEITETPPVNYAWDAKALTVTVPAGATEVTVEVRSLPGVGGALGGKLALVAAAISVPTGDEVSPGCSFTWGYWKNHSAFGNASHKRDAGWDNLPLAEDTPFFISGQTYGEVLQTKVQGNAYYQAAHQYVAAHLNLLAGSNPAPAAQDAFDAGTVLFQTYTPDQIKKLKGQDPVRKAFVDVNDTLTDFNEGKLGDGHCDDASLMGGGMIAQDLPGETMPEQFQFDGVYPNPFNPTTQIAFTLPEALAVRVSVYDVTGRQVQMLANGVLGAGAHTVTFEAGALPSGTYLYRVETPVQVVTGKMVLLK